MSGRNIAVVVGAVAVAIGSFILIRAGGDGSPGGATAATQGSATQASSTPESIDPAPTTAEPPEPPPTPEVRVVDGKPVGGVQRIESTKGEVVLFVVRSDASDEVHVHGYDLTYQVGPGAPATIRFRASIEGVFEVELEDRSIEIARVVVEP